MSEQPHQFGRVSEGAGQLLQLILDYITADRCVPSQSQLAELLNVQKRTIERWVRELRQADLLHSEERKRGSYSLQCHPDTIGRSIGRSADPTIGRHYIICRLCDRQIDRQDDRRPMRKTDESADRICRSSAHGGGGDLSSLEERSTTPQPPKRPEVLTETGRFLVREGFSRASAARFQHLALDLVRADVARRRASGAGCGAIVLAWEVEPPTTPSASAGRQLDAGALRSQYGDLFSYDEPAAPVEGNDDAAE
jgi:Mn-dependent DtxR family transcriptional regulator